MSELSTKLLRDEHYTSRAAAYQALQLDILNDALKINGISDSQTRRKICESFAFNSGVLLDQYWIRVDDNNIYPLLCFSKRHLDTDTNIEAIGDVAAPSEDFAWHEHAHGVAHQYFAEQAESVGDLLSGLVGYEFTLQKSQQVLRWLDREMSVEEAAAHFQEKDNRGDGCTYGETWDHAFEHALIARMRPGDQIRCYCADQLAWDNMRGEMGVALVRGDEVIAYLITGKS